MANLIQETCSNCGSTKCKSWEQLTHEEKNVVERLLDNSSEEKELRRYCRRCFYGFDGKNTIAVSFEKC